MEIVAVESDEVGIIFTREEAEILFFLSGSVINQGHIRDITNHIYDTFNEAGLAWEDKYLCDDDGFYINTIEETTE